MKKVKLNVLIIKKNDNKKHEINFKTDNSINFSAFCSK